VLGVDSWSDGLLKEVIQHDAKFPPKAGSEQVLFLRQALDLPGDPFR
jgi:hypothetical protein